MRILKTTLSPVVLFVAIFCLSGCNNRSKEPANIITDGSGLSIDLKWNTTTDQVASAVTDLDLDVLNTEGEVLSSYNSNEFEHVDLTNLFADGTYTIKISLFEIYKKSHYTLSVKGVMTGKTFSISGFFQDEIQPAIAILKITKAGDQFTMASL